MNKQLYINATETIKTVPARLNSEIIEEHVADAAEAFDASTGFNTSWIRDIEDVSKRICNEYGVTWYGE